MTAAAYGQDDTSSVTVQVITDKDNKKVIVDADGDVWQKTTKRKNVSTSWIGGFDLGFANFVDNTDYASASAQAFAPGADAASFDLRNGKSINFNLWIFSQKVNLINHNVNLKYALGLELNNYRFKNPIRFDENAPYVRWDNTGNRVYTKNKLAADYVTIPVMLNFDFGKGQSVKRRIGGNKSKIKYNSFSREWGFSAGISAGYLYSARNKTITSDEGKQKLKDNFNLNPWKLSYVAEINLGYFSLYGSYAMKGMFKDGLDITPYNVGIRF
ncbi:PorT family protein [Niabella ginsengisoli]|uniref:PorT family protein n=1 Tax=Niabella ginsengisoli TaxID=522298 RepID=A0ABS9SQF5_9BACT|nr:PorT family protein [Niabella ginsengisoli]MCH5600597.1 PorT family protein [Niabella ginsengisoli]